MSARPLLDEGLLIDFDGTQYECVSNSNNVLEFRSLDGMARHVFEGSELAEAIATRRVDVVSGRVTPHYIDTAKADTLDCGVIISLSEKNQRRLMIRSHFVLGVLKRGITQGQLKLIAEAADELAEEYNSSKAKDEPAIAAPSPQTIGRWMGLFEKRDKQIQSLIPKTAFGKRSRRVCKQNEQIISDVFEDLLFANGVGKISSLYSEYTQRVENENAVRQLRGEELIYKVARTTLESRFRSIPSFDRDVAINGKLDARHNHRVATGRLPSSFPLEFVEVDHGQLDLYVIDDVLMIPLGLPWITICRDRHTGIVLGIYISFRRTSLQSVFGALRHSLRPHDRVRELWPDISSYWPYGLGCIYVVDRGADFISPRLRLGLFAMGAEAQLCEARIPWHKGPIERYIGQTNAHLIECMPGRTYPFRKAPKGYNARQHAVVRFSSLVYLIHKWIAEVYHLSAHSRSLASPLTRWERSVAQMPIPVVPKIDDLIVLTGDPVSRKIGNEGIVHNWLTYTAPQLNEICEELGRVSIKFIPNPENLGFGMAIDPRDNRQFRVQCTAPGYANGLSEVQHAYIRRNSKIALRRSGVGEQLLQTQREIQESLAHEILAKDSADKANLYKVAIRAGIDSNAVLEGGARSVADLMSLATSAKQVIGTKSAEESVETPLAVVSESPFYDWI